MSRRSPPGVAKSSKSCANFAGKNWQGYEECLEYGMPVYKKDGTVEIAFASQKQYISLYVLKKEVVDEFRSALAGRSIWISRS
jgi:hypothetical protein